MTFLVPIDGSECSFRALEFALDMGERFDTDVHVIHLTDAEDEDTAALVERASEYVDADDVEVLTDAASVRDYDEVGRAILELCEARGYDHVVMGRHGRGVIERAVLGSASETVVESDDVRVTVVP